MPTLKTPPIRTSTRVSGTGLWISTTSPGADGALQEPSIVSRWTAHDPADSNQYDIGYPTYQFRVVRNYNEDAATSGPSHACLLHCNKIQKILIMPVYLNGDVSSSRSWTAVYADVSAITELGTAMATVPVFEPAPGLPDPEIATTVISIPTVSDKLGVHVFPKLKVGHVAPASPAITGAALGFSGAELTEWKWKGFVAQRTAEDPDVIRVFGGLEKIVARTGMGDQSQSANYIFEVKESDGSLVTAAEEVTVDIPFTPSQMVYGEPIVLKGGKTPTWWIIGRADSEFYNPVVPNSARLGTSPKVGGVASVGAIGIWATQDPTWKTWRKTAQTPTGVSHMPVQHLNNASVPHHEAPRDVGLTYDGLTQMLTPHTIDTDPGQDPVREAGKKALVTPPPVE